MCVFMMEEAAHHLQIIRWPHSQLNKFSDTKTIEFPS
jgi:hypothetical protein